MTCVPVCARAKISLIAAGIHLLPAGAHGLLTPQHRRPFTHTNILFTSTSSTYTRLSVAGRSVALFARLTSRIQFNWLITLNNKFLVVFILIRARTLILTCIKIYQGLGAINLITLSAARLTKIVIISNTENQKKKKTRAPNKYYIIRKACAIFSCVPPLISHLGIIKKWRTRRDKLINLITVIIIGCGLHKRWKLLCFIKNQPTHTHTHTF